MSNIAIIPQINLPAELLSQFQALTGMDDLDAGVSAGFPVMSIRGAKWRIVEGGEEHPIYMTGTKDLAPAVRVVILRANSAISKTYYAGAYVEGTDAKPSCYSNDGIAPAADAENPQCASCAQCPQNVWGSKISPSGSKIKACADVRRVAILPSDDMTFSPILLRVPGASLGDLAGYGKALKQRGIPYAAVVTKLAFDPDAAFPKITFTFERVLNAEEMATVAARISEPIVDDILGLSAPRGAPPAALAAPAADQFGIPQDIKAPAAPQESQPEPQQTAPGAEKVKRTRKAAPASEPEQVQEQASEPVENSMAADIDEALAALSF